MAVHLNAAQELTQPEGDRDFRNGYQTLEALASSLGDRLWVKETGCGISPQVARRLLSLGVQHIDVSGLGGTSWVAVERLRAAKTGPVRDTFSNWGIPTAAAVASVRQALGEKAFLLASGGIRNGLEAAVAQALGADAVGMALPFFRAQQAGGVEAVFQAVQAVLHDWRQAYLLTGVQNLQQLREVPRVVTGELKDWLGALSTP
jgi:isopentenyl-diphosphate delta-isomerase